MTRIACMVIIFTILLVMATDSGSGQTNDELEISGRVTDSSGKSLEGIKVGIIVSGKTISAIDTDKNGDYKLKVSKSSRPLAMILRFDGKGRFDPAVVYNLSNNEKNQVSQILYRADEKTSDKVGEFTRRQAKEYVELVGSDF